MLQHKQVKLTQTSNDEFIAEEIDLSRGEGEVIWLHELELEIDSTGIGEMTADGDNFYCQFTDNVKSAEAALDDSDVIAKIKREVVASGTPANIVVLPTVYRRVFKKPRPYVKDKLYVSVDTNGFSNTATFYARVYFTRGTPRSGREFAKIVNRAH